MLPEELQDSIKKLPPETQLLFKLVVDYFEKKLSDQGGIIATQGSRIKELEDQISKNSRNSSKPPSTDEFSQRVPKSLRKSSGKKVGGQKGHDGKTLKMVATPDKTEVHLVKECSCCHKDLLDQEADSIQRRQVIDLPPLKLLVTEHQVQVKRCDCGTLNKSSFPQWLNRPIQYGPQLKSLLVYLQDYQLLPYARTRELVEDLFNHQISTGTLSNIRQKAHQHLEYFEKRLKSLLTNASVVGFDETGVRVNQKRIWLHSYSTPHHAYYQIHPKRGVEAMHQIGILPEFKGIAVHDFWRSYYRFDCQHSLCNVHLIRDLIFVKERFEQAWSEELIQLLLKIKKRKDKAILAGKDYLSVTTLNRYRNHFRQLVQNGLNANPYKAPLQKKIGRKKKTFPRNLVERLIKYEKDYLRFFFDFKAPFDNNFSERDIRMMKVKLKISGGFRTFHGANHFSRIRSFIVTARKQRVNTLDALNSLFTDHSIISQLIRT